MMVPKDLSALTDQELADLGLSVWALAQKFKKEITEAEANLHMLERLLAVTENRKNHLTTEFENRKAHDPGGMVSKIAQDRAKTQKHG